MVTATPIRGPWSAVCPDRCTAGGSTRDCDQIGGWWAVGNVWTGGEEKLSCVCRNGTPNAWRFAKSLIWLNFQPCVYKRWECQTEHFIY